MKTMQISVLAIISIIVLSDKGCLARTRYSYYPSSSSVSSYYPSEVVESSSYGSDFDFESDPDIIAAKDAYNQAMDRVASLRSSEQDDFDFRAESESNSKTVSPVSNAAVVRSPVGARRPSPSMTTRGINGGNGRIKTRVGQRQRPNQNQVGSRQTNLQRQSEKLLYDNYPLALLDRNPLALLDDDRSYDDEVGLIPLALLDDSQLLLDGPESHVHIHNYSPGGSALANAIVSKWG